MPEYIDVNTGQVVVTSKQYVLRSLAIGSCIVLSAYDQRVRVAGMAHIMLPGKAANGFELKNRYAEDAIMHLLNLITLAGCLKENIDICLVGAGNVLNDKNDSICTSNIKSVNGILAREGLTVKASCLGGYERKAMYLNSRNGIVKFTCAGSEKIILWPG